jgi:hypothetical protein
MADLPQGIRVKAPNDKAPDFVKGSISIRTTKQRLMDTRRRRKSLLMMTCLFEYGINDPL